MQRVKVLFDFFISGHNKSNPTSLFQVADMVALTGWNASKFQCTLCGKIFAYQNALDMHMNVHTGAKPFVCGQESCGARFNHPSNLRRHVKIVHWKRNNMQQVQEQMLKMKKQQVNI